MCQSIKSPIVPHPIYRAAGSHTDLGGLNLPYESSLIHRSRVHSGVLNHTLVDRASRDAIKGDNNCQNQTLVLDYIDLYL